jgi:hypothetical protein
MHPPPGDSGLAAEAALKVAQHAHNPGDKPKYSHDDGETDGKSLRLRGSIHHTDPSSAVVWTKLPDFSRTTCLHIHALYCIFSLTVV